MSPAVRADAGGARARQRQLPAGAPREPRRHRARVQPGRRGRKIKINKKEEQKSSFTSLCLPLKTTAKAPCPIRSFLLNSNFPTVSMALPGRTSRLGSGGGGDAGAPWHRPGVPGPAPLPRAVRSWVPAGAGQPRCCQPLGSSASGSSAPPRLRPWAASSCSRAGLRSSSAAAKEPAPQRRALPAPRSARTGRRSPGRPLRAPLPVPSPGPARPAGAAWLRVPLKPRSASTPLPP